MNTMNPFLGTDGYKTGHIWQYPENTSTVFSNLTPRSLRHAPTGVTQVVVFSPQMVMMEIEEMFQENFFKKPKVEVCGEIQREYSNYLNTDYDVSHIEALHDLGYLPIRVQALPEGTTVPINVPVLTIYNTLPKFFWLTNFLETLISNLMWKPMTSATIAHQYKKNLVEWARKTDEENVGFVEFQGHDFSMRGLDSVEATISSGLGHATSFMGSDSLPVIYGARKYYGETGFIIGSVNATEHSVMCAGTKDDEIGTFSRLINQVYPSGILSIVSDTWDLWEVVKRGGYVEQLKDDIMNRDGKVVIRPDSGNPVDIICGTVRPHHAHYKGRSTPAEKGVIECLWDIFGGTINNQGYKVLDPHIGAIYGDSITIDRQEAICSILESKGFATTNVVLGIGSFTYQFNTRDTFGFAMKATYVELMEKNNELIELPVTEDEGFMGEAPETYKIIGREIFKDPITDDGRKKSARGLLQVVGSDGNYELRDGVTWDEAKNQSALQLIYENGEFHNTTTLTEIRERLNSKI